MLVARPFLELGVSKISAQLSLSKYSHFARCHMKLKRNPNSIIILHDFCPHVTLSKVLSDSKEVTLICDPCADFLHPVLERGYVFSITLLFPDPIFFMLVSFTLISVVTFLNPNHILSIPWYNILYKRTNLHTLKTYCKTLLPSSP